MKQIGNKLIYIVVWLMMISTNFAATTFKIAWVSRVPYSYQTNYYDVSQLKGLDIDFIQTLANKLGISITLVKVNERDLPKVVSSGAVDAVLGFTPDSFDNVVWSQPYRKEIYVAYLTPESKAFFYTTEELLTHIDDNNPLGFASTRHRMDDVLDAFVNDPKNASKVHVLNAEPDLLKDFLQGSLKTFIGDRVVFSTLLHRLHQWRYVKEINLNLEKPIAVGVLKNSPLAARMEELNTHITTLQKNGKLDRLVTEYLTPAVLMHTIDEGWLRFIELMGVVAFAIYAFIHGFYRHMAFVKTVGFSMVMVFTGPVLKDILTTGQIEFFRNPTYIAVVIGIVFVAHAIISTLRTLSYRQIRTYIFSENKDRWIQEIACAVGLSSYTVSGVLYAITSAETGWFWEGMLGTITATSGLLLAHELYKLPSKINFLFSELSFGWGVLLALYFTLSRSTIDFDQESIFLAVMIVFFGIFLSRMMALYHEISSIGFGRKLRETIDNL